MALTSFNKKPNENTALTWSLKAALVLN